MKKGISMKRLIVSVVGFGLLFLVIAPSAFCADVVGAVSDPQGNPVRGVEISVRDNAGKIVGKAMTDTKGHYAIGGLSPNVYNYTLDPFATPFKGGTVVSQLGSDGLSVDWRVSRANNALAMAKAGSTTALAGDPFGLSIGEFASVVMLGTGVVAAGVVGGCGAAGCFSESSSPTPRPSPPSSSSM
jgi:hypothetical protein